MCSSDSMRYISKGVWLATGLIALSVGLGALGIDVQSLLHLESMDKTVRYFAGLCGAYSLIIFVMSCCENCRPCK